MVIPGSLVAARQHVAHAYGVARGAGCRCLMCGSSPFEVAGPALRTLSAVFNDWDWCADRQAPDLCAGCARLVGGRPSRTHPPLRMSHFAVVDGCFLRPDRDQLVQLLRGSDPVEVIGWTAARKRHAVLRAGWCVGDQLYIGTERGQLVWTRTHDATLLDAVSDLRASARPQDILSGSYPPHVIVALGAAYRPAESVVARYRPSMALDMAVAIIPRPDHATEPVPMPVLTEHRASAELLLDLVMASSARDADPIDFWAQLLPRRLAACAARDDLRDAVAYLMQRLDVRRSGSTQQALAQLEALSDHDAAVVLRHWREHARLVIALTKMIKDERSTFAEAE